MRMQDHAANCGPASLANALAAVGVTMTQASAEELCRTTATDGTPPRRLLAAVRGLGRQPLVIRERRAEVAVLFLSHWLRLGRSSVICVDDGEHWVAAVGLIGERVLIADPADNELVLSLTRSELAERWAATKPPAVHYGVVL